jgi:spermidine synthase
MKGNEKLIIGDGVIQLSNDNPNSAVMHNGEKPLMEKLAEIVTKNGGDILEIGFGLHLSADAVQSNPNVTSHTIIEIHPEIFENAIEWVKNKPNTKIILGNWVDIIPTLNKKYDGILHDTHSDKNILNFLNSIHNICKENTIVGFFEYPIVDTRFDAIRFKIDEEYYNTIPYRKNQHFILNQFELKYTTYKNGKFCKTEKSKHII